MPERSQGALAVLSQAGSFRIPSLMGSPQKLHHIRTAVFSVHLVMALSTVAFLGSSLFNALKQGFVPQPETYGPVRVVPVNIHQIMFNFWHSFGRRPEEQTVAVWGFSGESQKRFFPGTIGSIVTTKLLEGGVKIRAHDPYDMQGLRNYFGNNLTYFRNQYEALNGVDALVLADDFVAYQNIDWNQVRNRMRRKAVFDCNNVASTNDVENAGLVYLPQYYPLWPVWLEKEYLDYVEYLRKQMETDSKDTTVLLNPLMPLNIPQGRTRWYLPLSYHLYPAKIMLPKSAIACGSLVEFLDWMRELNALQAGQGPFLDGPALQSVVQQTSADFILNYRPFLVFRNNDWQLIRVEK